MRQRNASASDLGVHRACVFTLRVHCACLCVVYVERLDLVPLVPAALAYLPIVYMLTSLALAYGLSVQVFLHTCQRRRPLRGKCY